MFRKVFALLLCTALPLPALGQTHVIAELGTAPLIGSVASTQQLQGDVRAQRAIFEVAGKQLGLTSAQFAQFAQRIAQHQVTYVVIPRHLDAMSWRSGNRVHVLHDVVIPAGTMGWEVDLAENGQILALFIPNKCGNLSLLRKPAPRIAKAAPAAVAHVAAAPAPQTSTEATAAPAATPAPTPAPYVAAAMSTGGAPTHHFRAWPLLLLPIIALFASHGHSGGIGTLTPAAPVSAPLPTPLPVTGCPTPAPH